MVLPHFSLWCKRILTCPADTIIGFVPEVAVKNHLIKKKTISRIRNTLDTKSKKMIYYSLIHPYLTYCINVWPSTY